MAKTKDRVELGLATLAGLVATQAKLIESFQKDYTPPDPRQLAKQIVNTIMRNGSNEQASRLVIELTGGRNGGGWCREALIDTIEDSLKQALR